MSDFRPSQDRLASSDDGSKESKSKMYTQVELQAHQIRGWTPRHDQTSSEAPDGRYPNLAKPNLSDVSRLDYKTIDADCHLTYYSKHNHGRQQLMRCTAKLLLEDAPIS